nr:alpha/beta hydrolase [Anaerolineae bacterium]
IDLSQYNSINNARDVHELMTALEYDQYNLYGISYGTRLAMTIMRDFPEDVRSVVLDSSYPKTIRNFENLTNLVDEVAMELFNLCVADEVCNTTYPDLANRFNVLLERLSENPLDLGDGMVITPDVFSNLFSALNHPRTVAIAPYIPLTITELEQGKTDTFLLLMQFIDGQVELIAPTLPQTVQPVPSEADALLRSARIMAESALELLQNAIQLGNEANEIIRLAGIEQTPARVWLTAVNGFIQATGTDGAQLIGRELMFLLLKPKDRATLQTFIEQHFQGADVVALQTGLDALSETDVTAVFELLATDVRIVTGTNIFANAMFSYNCHDEGPFDTLEGAIQNEESLIFPLLTGNNFETQVTGIFAMCDEVVIPFVGSAPDIESQPVVSDIPTLVLAGSYDVQTPPSWNRLAYEPLTNAYFGYFVNSGHGVITYSQCAKDVTLSFINHPDREPDMSCVATLATPFVLPQPPSE